jgi:hypothetical protein
LLNDEIKSKGGSEKGRQTYEMDEMFLGFTLAEVFHGFLQRFDKLLNDRLQGFNNPMPNRQFMSLTHHVN